MSPRTLLPPPTRPSEEQAGAAAAEALPSLSTDRPLSEAGESIASGGQHPVQTSSSTSRRSSVAKRVLSRNSSNRSGGGSRPRSGDEEAIVPPLRISSVPKQLRDSDGTAKGIYEAVGITFPEGVATVENGGIYVAADAPLQAASEPTAKDAEAARTQENRRLSTAETEVSLDESNAESTPRVTSAVLRHRNRVSPGPSSLAGPVFPSEDEEPEPLEAHSDDAEPVQRDGKASDGDTVVGKKASLETLTAPPEQDSQEKPSLRAQRSRCALGTLRKLDQESIIKDAGPASPVLIRSESVGSIGYILNAEADGSVAAAAEPEDQPEEGPRRPTSQLHRQRSSDEPRSSMIPLTPPRSQRQTPTANVPSLPILDDAIADDARQTMVVSPLDRFISSLGGHVSSPPTTLQSASASSDLGASPDLGATSPEMASVDGQEEEMTEGTQSRALTDDEAERTLGLWPNNRPGLQHLLSVVDRQEGPVVNPSLAAGSAEDLVQDSDIDLGKGSTQTILGLTFAAPIVEPATLNGGLTPPASPFKKQPPSDLGLDAPPAKRWSLDEMEEASVALTLPRLLKADPCDATGTGG